MADLSGQFAPENYNRVLAALLMKQGLDTSPIQSWTQGAARLAQALVGARYRDLDQRDTLAAMQYNAIQPMGNKVADALSSPQPTSTPQPEQGGLIPAAIRYNNPGAQWPGPVATQFGSTDSGIIGGGNKIAQFPDQESGAAAQFALLQKNYAGMPLSAAIQKWSGGNSSPEYTTAISKATGLAPDTVLTPEILQNPSIAIPVAKAMAQVEAGRPYPMTDQQWQQAHSRANPQMAQASPIDAMEANVNRTLADPNVPLAVKQKAYAYKQWIIQHRLEQNMKYGPEALTGEGALAGAKATAESNAKLPGQIILKQTPAYSDIPANAGAKTAAEEAAKVSPDIIFGQATAAGAKTTAEQTAKQAVQTATTEKTSRQAAGFMHGLVNEAITQIDKHPKTAAGPVGQYTSGMQWSHAGVLDSTLLGIRSRISFEELNKMRAASPTGGAIGQVSDPEEKMLGSVYGGITTGLPAEVLKARLRRLERVYNAVVNVGPEAAAKEFSKLEPGDVQDAQTSGGIRKYNPATGKIE